MSFSYEEFLKNQTAKSWTLTVSTTNVDNLTDEDLSKIFSRWAPVAYAWTIEMTEARKRKAKEEQNDSNSPPA